MSEVNHLSHYLKCAITIEPIEVTARLSSCYGQALNYILRAPYKNNTVEDYQKALFYLEKAKEIKDYPYYSFDEHSILCMYIQLFIFHSNDSAKIFNVLFESFDTGYCITSNTVDNAITAVNSLLNEHDSL